MPTSSASMIAVMPARAAPAERPTLWPTSSGFWPGMPGNAARRAAPVASEKTASGKSISSQISQASAVSPPEIPIRPTCPRVGRFLLTAKASRVAISSS